MQDTKRILTVGKLFELKRSLDAFAFPVPDTDEETQAAWQRLRMACADVLDSELS